MSLFFVRTDRSAVPPAQKDAARLLIEEQARKLNPKDPGYTAALVEVVDQVITSQAALYRWSTDDARILRAELANLAVNNLSVYLAQRDTWKAAQAHTALSDAKDIFREEDLIFRSFTRVKEVEANPNAEQVLAVNKGLGRLAASLGAPRAADGWYAREIGSTVEGNSANQVGEYGKRARPFMMPFTELRTLCPSDVENPILLEVLRNNRMGVSDALRSIAAGRPGVDKADSTKVRAEFILPSSVLNLCNLLGTQLSGFREYVDRLQPAELEKAPELVRVFQEGHRLYANRNHTSLPAELREPFEKLTPAVQRRNVPGVLGALYGLTQANRVVGDVLQNGVLLRDGSATESCNDLQLHLVSSASHAMALPFEEGNAVFAGAVADEIGLLLAHRHQAAERLPEVQEVVESAALAAGREFQVGGNKAKAAPGIALEHIGALERALHPDNRLDDAAWKKKAQDVLKRAKLEDLAAICRESFPMGELPSDLNAALKQEIDPKDYFYGRIDELKARGPKDRPLDDDEKSLLRDLLYLANATWKVGQVHRAIGEGDLSRVNPSERDRVFNPYDMCVTAAGSPVKSFFCVAKDLLVLRG